MDKITTKKDIYTEVHKEFYNKGINKKSSDILFDRLVKAMSYIEYNGLNEDFFEFQDDLDAELKDGWGNSKWGWSWKSYKKTNTKYSNKR